MQFPRRVLGLAWLLAVGVVPLAQGEPWSEKLGFPVGSRVVVIDVHELGICWEFNAAGREVLQSGNASSASLVSTGPRFPSIAAWARTHTEYDWGVSIALTNPYRNLRWKFISPQAAIPELMDGEGYPWTNVVQLVNNANPEAVEHELLAQLAAARANGVQVTHLSGYYGTIFSRPDLARVLLKIARQHWIPTTVVDITHEQIERFTRAGFPIEDEMLQLIRDYPLPKIDDIREIPVASSVEEKRTNFIGLLESLPPSLTVVVARPTFPSPGVEELVPDYEQRVLDLEMLKAPELKAAFDKSGIILTNWREIMERFEAGGKRQLGR